MKARTQSADSLAAVEEDDSHHKHIEHHQADGSLRVVAVVEDAKLKTADHEVEHCQPGVPDGAELLQQIIARDPGERPIDGELKAPDCSRGQQRSIHKRGGDLELLLVLSEEDIEGPSKAPHVHAKQAA
ncbi:MAG: hypothetical protein FRX49_09209 [Trebouxia sp. A1-2]|nr:MAG: hypothetical protein FRX49_09209 [Trebouxia sp. A1-2]